MAATPLPGFAPGTLVTPIAGREAGFGQVSPVLDVEEFSYTANDVVQLGVAFAPIIDNTDGPTLLVDSLFIANTTGGGLTYDLRVVPAGTTPAGTEYNLATANTLGANSTEDFLTNLGCLVLKPGDVLEMLGSAATSINVRACYREPRHQ